MMNSFYNVGQRFLTVLLGFCLLILAPSFLCAQFPDNFIEVKILDSESKDILIGATAINLTNGQGAISDEKGIVKLSYSDEDVVISFSYLGYFKRNYRVGELPRIVYLEKNINIIEEVSIVSRRTPQILTEKAENISDFVLDKDRLLLLSRKIGGDFRLKLTDLDGKLIIEEDLPDLRHIQELFTSCFGTHFLVGEFEVLQLHVEAESIQIVERSSRKLFDQYIKPCVTRNEQFIYFEQLTLKDQIAKIYAFSLEEEESFLFAGVEDDQNLHSYQYDAPYMAFAEGTGPLYLGIHALDPRDAMEWGDMLSRNFYLPVDYFIMSHKNEILLFDHEKHQLRTYDRRGNLQNQNSIDYSSEKGWKSKDNIFFDQVEQKLYTLHRTRAKKLFTEIDLLTGASKNRFSVKANHFENIAIHNRNVYFTSFSAEEGVYIMKRIEL